MKKNLFNTFVFILSLGSLFFVSCVSKPEPEEPQEIIAEPVIEETEIEETESTYVEEDPIEDIVDDSDDEYLRSIDELESSDVVSKQEFTDDKTAILNTIEELSEIMENQDANEWLKFINPESIIYYSNPANLRKAQKKLPNKLIELKHIEDYFKYVFIPSRKRSKVDEIRYISKTNIKAVEVKEDFTVVVYYYFTKINERWYVTLPTL